MRWFVYGQDQAVADWVNKRIPHARFEQFSAIGLAEDDKIIAGVVYHNYIHVYGNIEISMAADSPKWATPESLRAFLSYPFTQLRCRRITTCTPASNKRALKFNYGIGFQKEGVIRQGYGKEDMIICGMVFREAKKWLKPNKRKELYGINERILSEPAASSKIHGEATSQGQ